jgi:phosphoesterase RecJ-like protein
MPNSPQSILDALSACKRVLVTTHVRPDGDALGTSAAMVLAMRAKGIDAEVLLLSQLPTKYSFIFHDAQISYTEVGSDWPAGFGFDGFDALLVVDTGTWSQLPGLKERLADWRGPKIVVDHHLTQEDWADVKYVVTTAAAAAEIAIELLQLWRVPMTPVLAAALFVGIATDTGWFQFSNTRPDTLRRVATLMEAGVDTDRIYQLLYQNERAERIALQTRAMRDLELRVSNRLAILCVEKNDFAQTCAKVADTENLINIPLQIRAIEVSVLLVDPPEGGAIRVSLRSKGQIDVAKFAEQFGGGGHARASGCTLAEARHRVVAALEKSMG